MSELVGALKTLLVSFLILMALQMRVGGVTIESKLTDWYYASGTSKYLQQTASGAVLSIKQASATAASFISEKINTTKSESKAVKN